jgi:molybdenum cofactor biosynthesis enzyme MoaA
MATHFERVSYLRLVLHQETDGLLLARRRPAGVVLPIPEVKELKLILRVLVDHGIEKIRLSGDDPALREDLLDLVAMLAGLEGVRELAITTRGIGLDGRIAEMQGQGVRAINFNLDTLQPERYAKLHGADRFAEVWSAVQAAVVGGLTVKLNVVVQRDFNEDEIGAFVAVTQDQPLHVRFVEWNAASDRIAPPEQFLSAREVMAAIGPPLVPREPAPTDGPALVYSMPGHKGSVGFIPNVTEHFCSSCDRIGLTDFGDILSCIFGHGLNLVRHLRSPGGTQSVAAFVDRVLRRKVLLASKLEGIHPESPADVARAAAPPPPVA